MLKYFSLLICALWLSNAEAQTCLAPGPCPGATLEVCDSTQNNSDFWNDLFWWDAPNMSPDNAEAPVSASFTFSQNCGGALTIYYQLFLDLDHDNTPETLVDSRDLPGAGVVYYGNLYPPPAGQEAEVFDSRLIPDGERYRFALETVQNGNDYTARLRWNTADNPLAYTDPELPDGQHYIRWVAKEAGGEQIECSYNIKVTDCKEPTIVCKNGLSINIMPTQMVTMWGVDFIQYAEDNISPLVAIELGLRKPGQGSGFPLDNQGEPQKSITFFCTDLGVNEMEVWSRDAAGNADYCLINVLVEDPFGNCTSTNTLDLTLCARQWNSGAPINHVTGLLDNDSQVLPLLTLYDESPDAAGCLTYSAPIKLGANYTFTPQLENDPLNGVDALDLVRISQYILATNPLSPFAQIAADANKSNTITGADIITIRNLLLGQITEFPNAPSWRFIDAGTTFSNPQYAFDNVPFIESKIFSPMADLSLDYAFTGIKVGDVNGSASPGIAAPEPDTRSVEGIELADRLLEAGSTTELCFRLSNPQQWLALQMGLLFDPASLRILDVDMGDLSGTADDNALAQLPGGQVNLVWYQPIPAALESGSVLVKVRVSALASVWLHDAVGMASGRLAPRAFDADGKSSALVLLFTEGGGASLAAGLAFPNPTLGSVALPVYLPEAAGLRFEIFDVSGQSVYTQTGLFEAGARVLQAPAEALSKPGLYAWRLSSGSKTLSGRIVRQ